MRHPARFRDLDTPLVQLSNDLKASLAIFKMVLAFGTVSAFGSA